MTHIGSIEIPLFLPSAQMAPAECHSHWAGPPQNDVVLRSLCRTSRNSCPIPGRWSQDIARIWSPARSGPNKNGWFRRTPSFDFYAFVILDLVTLPTVKKCWRKLTEEPKRVELMLNKVAGTFRAFIRPCSQSFFESGISWATKSVHRSQQRHSFQVFYCIGNSQVIISLSITQGQLILP